MVKVSVDIILSKKGNRVAFLNTNIDTLINKSEILSELELNYILEKGEITVNDKTKAK